MFFWSATDDCEIGRESIIAQEFQCAQEQIDAFIGDEAAEKDQGFVPGNICQKAKIILVVGIANDGSRHAKTVRNGAADRNVGHARQQCVS